MKYLQVKNWERFQHYKNKDNPPPWIKLYNELLTNYEFLELSEIDRYKVMAIWLLASKTRNKIPNDAAYVARCIGVKKVDLDSLVSRGWLEPVYSDSRQTLESVYTQTETENIQLRAEQTDTSRHSLVRLLMVLRDSDSQTEAVIRSFNPSDGDLEAAREAATGPGVVSPVKVAVDVLKKRRAQRVDEGLAA
jgi:hypothetical protein